MKIALVNQPIGRVKEFRDDQSFSGGSITLWNYHMARELGQSCDPTIFTLGMGDPGSKRIHGLPFEFVDAPHNDSKTIWAKRRGKILRSIGLPQNFRRPYFASGSHYRAYVEATARLIKEGGFDLVSVTNYSQFVPELRRQNPNINIHLHMQCEWLNQLDPDWIRPRLAQCDFVSGCSQFIVDEARKVFPEIKEKSFALLNGVHSDLFHPAENPQPDEAPEIVFIGRVSPEKGTHVLFEAFNGVVEQFPTAKLTLIGSRSPAPYEYIVALDRDPLVQDMARFYSGTRSNYREYLDTIPSEATRPRIEYVDDIPQDCLVEAYQRAAIFVFPSAWNEPFGMPVIEAMACGTAVVSTYSGGIPEFVSDQQTGLLVERGDAAALRDAILSLLTNPTRRDELARAGCQYVTDKLTWRDTAERYLSQMA